jgi:hypothetical protein
VAGNADAFAFVLASARRTLGQVQSDYRLTSPTPGRGAALADHVSAMVNLIDTQVTRAEGQFAKAGAPAQQALVRNVRLFTRLARALHESLPWLDRSGSAVLDLGTTYFVDEMASAIVGQGVETVCVPDSGYMYSTLSWPFRLTALKYLKVDVARGTRPIVLFFPLKEKDSVVLHAAFAHELGHAAADEHQLVQAVLQPLQGDAAFQAALAAAQAFISSTTGLDPTAAERVSRGRLADWTEELLCDALALQYLGPSYLFSFASFVLASNWTDPQPTHPPPTLRVGLLVDQLVALGWDPWLKDRFPDLWEWMLWVKGAALPPLTPDTEFLRDVVLQQAGDIRATAAGRLGGETYIPSAFTGQESDLCDLLARRILPVELAGVTVDRRNILLSGWTYTLKHEPDGSEREAGPAALAEALSELALQRFLGKALELSTIAELWRGLP